MSLYPNLNEPEYSKIKTRDDNKNLKYQTEKHDQKNILKFLRIDNENCKKQYKTLNKKKVLLNITKVLVGSVSTTNSSTMCLINPGAVIIILSSKALLTSIAILITIEYNLKFEIRYTKIRNWPKVITLLYEKTWETSMVEKKNSSKEAAELKKIYIFYIDKRKKL